MSHRPRLRASLVASLVLVLALIAGAAVPGGGAANASTGTASVRGVVVMPDGLPIPTGSNQLRAVKVSLVSDVVTGVVSTPVAQDGSFMLSGLAAGVEHRIRFSAGIYGSLLRTYHDGAFTYESTVPLILIAGESRDLGSIPLRRPGSITGSMSGADGTILQGGVQIVSGPPGYWQAMPSGAGAIFSVQNQSYSVGGLPPGDYVMRFSGLNWKTVFSGGSVTLEGATPVAVGLGENVTANIVLPPAPRVTGQFTVNRDPSVTTPIQSTIYARPFPGATAGTNWATIRVNAEGEYRFSLPPGTYQICAQEDGSPDTQAIFTHCYGQDGANPDGLPVTIGSDSVSGIDLPVQGAARITLRDVGRPDPANAGSRVPTNHIFAFFWRFDETLGYWVNEAQASHIGGGFGTLMSPPIPAGDYRIQLQYLFIDGVHEPTQQYREYFPGGVTRFSDAGIITVVEGESRIIASTTVTPTPLGVDRVWGSDRFSGSAAISQQVVPDAPAPVVYIANGLNYPDALSAVPLVSGFGGSLLLVWPDHIPASVEAELRRLQPERIVIVGGTGSVSSAVESRLRSFVDSPSDVERHAGADRYAASRTAIERAVDGAQGMPVIIATGSNYPDALAAGPVAAALGGVVLLVDGSAGSLDAPTRALLNRLQPSLFIIAGGPGSVSPGIEGELLGRTDLVFRAGGQDRYEAAATLNSILVPFEGFRYDRPGGADLVFVASGANFADALAGGPLAARHGAPLYLTPPTCLTSQVIDAVEDHGAREIMIIGGPGSVTPAVQALFLCGMSATRGEVTELQRAVAEAIG